MHSQYAFQICYMKISEKYLRYSELQRNTTKLTYGQAFGLRDGEKEDGHADSMVRIDTTLYLYSVLQSIGWNHFLENRI